MESLIDRITRVPVDSLTPHPLNARRGNVAVIAESLRVNSQFAPIVVQASTHHVLAGNHTLAAALQLGWTEIDAVILDVDDARAYKIMLAANRTADLGGYDRDALAELLSYTEETGYAGTGYTEHDVQLLIAPPLSVEQLEHYRSPEAADDALWPLLKLRISPKDLDAFYGLTIDCADLNDDSARFRYLLDRAKAAPPITG